MRQSVRHLIVFWQLGSVFLGFFYLGRDLPHFQVTRFLFKFYFKVCGVEEGSNAPRVTTVRIISLYKDAWCL